MTFFNRINTGIAALPVSAIPAIAQQKAAAPAPAGHPAAEDIREVHGLVEIPEPPAYGLWIAAAVGLLILLWLIWKFARRQRKANVKTPAEKAIDALRNSRGLMAEQSAEPFTNAVTNIVRTYLDERFGIAAPRRTTEEFLEDLKNNPRPELIPFSGELNNFLRSGDAVKFGRGAMTMDSRKDLIRQAVKFIQATSESATTAPTDAPTAR